MLAPVLARLEAVPGVSAARVDSSGRFFWIAVEDGADPSGVSALTLPLLGTGARTLAADRAKAQLAAGRQGDPWLGAAEVMTLSFVESRLLSVRIAGEVRAGTGATPEQHEEIAEAIREALFAAMERVHSEGGRRSSGWIYEEWPVIAANAAERCAGRIPGDLRLQVAELLPGLLAR